MTEAAFPHIQAIDSQARKPNLLTLPIRLTTATGLRDGGLKAGSSAEGQSVGFQANKHCAATSYDPAGFANFKGQRVSLLDYTKLQTELLFPSLNQTVNPPTEGRTSSRPLILCLT